MIVYQNGIFVGGTHIETRGRGIDLDDQSFAFDQRRRRRRNIRGDDRTRERDERLAIDRDAHERRGLCGRRFVDTKSEFAAVRVLANGGLDPTYAVVTPISLGDDVAYAGAIEPGGNLVAAGSENDASAIAVARYTQVPLPPPPDAGSDADTDADASDADMDADPTPTHRSTRPLRPMPRLRSRRISIQLRRRRRALGRAFETERIGELALIRARWKPLRARSSERRDAEHRRRVSSRDTRRARWTRPSPSH